MYNNFEKLINAIGLSEESDDQKILDELAKIYTAWFNTQCHPQEQGCIWDIKYLNYGEIVRISKLKDGSEISYIEANTETGVISLSNEKDEDLELLRQGYMIAMINNII